jgi:hypothetical protein
MAVEVDGMLWKPRRGATASSGEFIWARSLVAELHRLDAWNPWVLEDRAGNMTPC